MSTSEFPDVEAPSDLAAPERLESPELDTSLGELAHQESSDQLGQLAPPGQPETEDQLAPPGQLETEDQLAPPGQALTPEQPSPELLPTVSPEAINFLTSITTKELQTLHFTDSLVTISDTGRELGEFTITVLPILYNSFSSLSVHANSHGSIDSIPCGTSISAYLTQNLETLEHYHHEYIKLKEQPLVRKTNMKKGDDGYVVTNEITSGQNVKSKTLIFKLEEMNGFVSEASNLILLRILAQRNKVPDNMVFLSFDTEMKLSPSTYMDLGHRMMKIGKEEKDVLGIQRTVHSEENGPMSWQCNFLPDGHLTSRVQVGSPVTMVLTQIPHVRQTDEEDPKPVFEKKPLNWEEDMQLYFKFIDRTEALKADYCSYLRHHPELRSLMADFLEFLLLRKPHDVVTFAAEYFASFSNLRTEQSPFLTTNKSSPFKEQ
ncbi:ciliogenesis-associated TTC17-interacting protein isoform X3 [Carcharodon carcharias]|uniref:ciliogenesis-associated TTC17-interacting protein isoform X2 n=1 Tax=Carcharodon carcharias TaxID=13397 RepID=UPI001B7E6F2A|nr:ciliogenesis-associated TTC17-interacting protein isoform X2 [Carcharodon carcharias]XP_041056576.1 ciliogenesis-associated TTC17-interacting protein isoform X3 [Carcharodon carcharias]